jgi:hypothetical protein
MAHASAISDGNVAAVDAPVCRIGGLACGVGGSFEKRIKTHSSSSGKFFADPEGRTHDAVQKSKNQ